MIFNFLIAVVISCNDAARKAYYWGQSRNFCVLAKVGL